MVSKRNGEIDLLRFIFALTIVFFHFSGPFKMGFFQNGYIGVEFFFVVSGYLMAKHVSCRRSGSRDLGIIADETWRYLINKVKTFYSYYVSVILLQLVIRFIIVRQSSITDLAYRVLQSIPTFSLVFMGLNSSASGLYVGNTWYLSAMIIAIFLLYPLLLRHYKFTVEMLFPVISLFILGYLYATKKTIAVWESFSGTVYFGVLRAVSEMALGGCLFKLSAIIIEKKPRMLCSDKTFIKTILTLFKTFCYVVVFVFAYGRIFGKGFEDDFNFHALLFCSLGILFSFSDIGFCIPDNKTTRYLGKISLPIFIYHGFIRWTAWDYIGHSISVKLYVALIIMSIIASILLMYITDFLAGKMRTIIEKC